MSTNETFVCALDGCDATGIKTTHNQKYCCSEHCQIATNAKIMERYYELEAIRKGKRRTCKKCHSTVLSRYNKSNTCAGCEVIKRNNESMSFNEPTFLVS